MSFLKPEETVRNTKGWYGLIKNGAIKACPVEGCGGKLVHEDMFTWYECETCGWTDEFQDLQDLGYQEPTPGWPKTTRTCAICGARSDGSSMPMVEAVRCPIHPDGHFICRWRLDDDGHMVECACSAGNVGTATLKVCPLNKST